MTAHSCSVDSCCILQGPVAVHYSTTMNEPAADILSNIVQEHCRMVAAEGSEGKQGIEGNEGKIPVLHCFSKKADPSLTDVYDVLCKGIPWRDALLRSKYVVKGQRREPNPLPLLFRERDHQVWECPNASHVVVKEKGVLKLEMQCMPDQTTLVVTIHDVPPLTVGDTAPAPTSLVLKYSFHPDTPAAPLHATVEENELVKTYYRQLWFPNAAGERKGPVTPRLSDRTFTHDTLIDSLEIEAFCTAIRNGDNGDNGGKGSNGGNNGGVCHPPKTPLDYAIVVSWQSLIKSLFPEEVDGNILNLVHLSNSYTRLPGPLFEHVAIGGATLRTTMNITNVSNGPTGKTVTVNGTIAVKEGNGDDNGDDNGAVLAVESSFFFRGAFTDHENSFTTTTHEASLDLSTHNTWHLLRSKKWFRPLPTGSIVTESKHSGGGAALAEEGTVLGIQPSEIVRVRVTHRLTATGSQTTGTIYRLDASKRSEQIVALVARESSGTRESSGASGAASACPVVSFLQRQGVEATKSGSTVMQNGGYNMLPRPDAMAAPVDNVPYASASRDLNPIHRHPYIADLAGLPTTIVHGMWR
jgi:fatty acid synthase subunit beta